ncbi:CBS domain-containing protein [Labrenzia sp. R5_0]|uniref:CBS domain-containing protein n=1 Tax=Labrenzia sp. R5_0 TaxID=2821108 RepID=UPI001AD9FAFA|nr:CBS domain-containing protein [Labrenzia sp. R5_0]MBO9462477.1 CBS domain-containing protein [Labrenzia sp. R5_0]
MQYFLIFAACVVAALLFKKFVKNDVGDTLLGAIIFLPTLLVWIQSNNISEFTGFGLSAKFNVEASKPVSALKIGIPELVRVTDDKASDLSDADLFAHFESCSELFVLKTSIIPKEKEKLDKFIVDVSWAIKSSIACGKLSGVIVLDDNNRYLGTYDDSFYLEALSMWSFLKVDEKTPVNTISEKILTLTIFGASLKFPDKRITAGEGFEAAINENQTLQEAFAKFQTTEADFLVVTDELGVFKGIIRYRDVVDSFLSVLIGVKAPDVKESQ